MVKRLSVPTVVVGCSVLALLVGVVLSPLLLTWVSSVIEQDWILLGNVGQAYGAASAVLSGLALLGVALSVWVQAIQSRATRVQGIRAHQLELFRYLMDNPGFSAPGWGPPDADRAEDRRRLLFTTLTFHFFKAGYVSGTFPEGAIRSELAQEVFSTDLGRRYWADNRRFWSADTAKGTRTDRKFVRILDEEYDRALSSGPAEPFERDGGSAAAAAPAPGPWPLLAGLGVGLGMGLAAGRGRRHRRTR